MCITYSCKTKWFSYDRIEFCVHAYLICVQFILKWIKKWVGYETTGCPNFDPLQVVSIVLVILTTENAKKYKRIKKGGFICFQQKFDAYIFQQMYIYKSNGADDLSKLPVRGACAGISFISKRGGR